MAFTIGRVGYGVEAIDEDAWQRFCSLFQGEPEAVQDILRVYLDESEVLGRNLREALAIGDLAAARRAAHSLRSTSAQVGATRLGDVCARIEDATKQGDLDRALEAARGFPALLEASRDGLLQRV